MADTDIVQVIAEARVDARSLSEFISKGTSFTVSRRLAPSIYTLDYYLDKFGAIADNGAMLIEQTIKNSGFTIVGKFADGATVSKANDVLQDASGKLYRWAGSLPKSVPTGSTPESSGGFGANAWLEVSDAAIRQELAVEYGVSNAANSIVTVDSVAELEALPESAKREDLRYLVKEYHAGSTVGGGIFEYNPTSSIPDDGGRRIGDFVRETLPNDTPFTFAKYGYDFQGRSEAAEIVAQRIFDTVLTIPESEHIVIELGEGAVFGSGTATLRRANLTLRGRGTCYIEGNSVNHLRFIEILLSEGRNKNLIIEGLSFVGLFDGTLLKLYQDRATECSSRFYVSGVDGLRVDGISARRVSIPLDVRNSNNVQINNISLKQGNCGVSVINCTSVNVSNVIGIDCTGSAIDFSSVRGGTVTNILGFTSEEGRDLAEEFFDMGSCEDLVISNLQSIGPTNNVIRIKFEEVEQPFSNISVSNVEARGSEYGVIIQPSTNSTGKLTEHLHFRGITLQTNMSCFAMTGTTPVYNVSIVDFDLLCNDRSAIVLPGVSDISISNGKAFCSAVDSTRAAIELGERDAYGGIQGDRITISNVTVGSTNKGREAVYISNADSVSMDNVTISESGRAGIELMNCRDVRLNNMNVKNTGRAGVSAKFTSSRFNDGDDVGFYINSSAITDFGFSSAYIEAIRMEVDDVSVKGVVIKGNYARTTPLVPQKNRTLALFNIRNGGSFELGSIVVGNLGSVITSFASGIYGSVLVKDNNMIDEVYTEPEPESEPEV